MGICNHSSAINIIIFFLAQDIYTAGGGGGGKKGDIAPLIAVDKSASSCNVQPCRFVFKEAPSGQVGGWVAWAGVPLLQAWKFHEIDQKTPLQAGENRSI